MDQTKITLPTPNPDTYATTLPKRVAIVTSIHPDFDSRIWKHASILGAHGIGVDLICPWTLKSGDAHKNVTFHTFPKVTSRAYRPFLIPIRVLPRLWAILNRVDIVHFHDIDLLPLMVMISAFKPVVYDVHENYADEMLVREWIPQALRAPLSFAVRWGQFALASIIRNVVLVAPSQENDFRYKHFRRIYIYNYASLALLDSVRNNYAERPDTIIFIGSQHINNGSLLLLDIVEELAKRLPNVRFKATDRFSSLAFREHVLAEIERRNLNENLELIPNVKPHELMSVLNQATIGISPNLRVAQQINGIHTKIFEYMAAGLPMVVSDLPHQVGEIEHSKAGILAQPESIESFVVAIERLIRDRGYAERLGRNGQQYFRESCCYESQGKTMLEFYGVVMAARGAA